MGCRSGVWAWPVRSAELEGDFRLGARMPLGATVSFLLSGLFLPADLATQTGNWTTIDASTRPDCPGGLRFFVRVQTAIRADDRQTVAALINNPMRTRLNHPRIRDLV